MGYSSYSISDRTTRATSLNFASASRDSLFTQQKERKIHESMSPLNITPRICANSEAHPNTIPILLALDVTGSMLNIPEHLIREGLPKLMGGIIEKGALDASLLFVAIGDHVADRHPLQIGQFESGDAELDMWLTRSYLEAGGGGNAGESYLLAWYAGAFLTECEAFTKQNRKGILITIGDEPNLPHISANALRELTGGVESKDWASEELLKKAQEKWEVFHINISHNLSGSRALDGWKKTLGERCYDITDYKKVPKIVTQIVLDFTPKAVITTPITSPPSNKTEIML